jgi:hypothetical protein
VTLALMIATTRPLPFGAALLALGVSTAWLSDARGWSWLRWPPAFAADGLAVALLARSDVMSAESHRAAIILLVALFAVYMLLVSWRAFVQDRRLQASEMIQAACAVAFGLFGALFVARSGPPSAWPILGGLGVVAAVGAYSAVFGILRRRMHARANVVFFTTLGLVLLVVGGGAVVAGHARVAWCGAFAIAAAVVGARASEPYLSLHGALLCIVMAGVSGAIGWASSAWFTTGPWGAPGFAYVVTGLVVAGCLFLSTRTPRAFPAMARLMADTSRAVEAALILVGGGAVAIWFFGPIVAGTPIDSGALATFRTAVLAGAGLGAAALSRFPIFAPVAWLVYPVLAAGGVKLVFDDFPHSAAATLFAALAMYGVALIVAPRLARRS